MAQNDSPISLQACAMRITRLTSAAAPASGSNNGYCTNQFAKFDAKPEVEAGVEFTIRNACGALTTVYKDRDVIKRYGITLELQVPDPEIHELLTGAAIITSGGVTIGHQAPPLATNPSSYNFGVGMEVWTKAVIVGSQATTNPYLRWVFPQQFWTPGEKNFENADMKVAFDGFMTENTNFGVSLWTTNPVTGQTYTRSYTVFRDPAANFPTQQAGYISTPYAI